MEYYTIGKLSKLTCISVDALRYYDEIGLLKPAFIDQLSGYRYYTDECAAVLAQILELKEYGLELSKIKAIMADGQSAEDVLRKQQLVLLERKRALDESIGKLNARLNKVKEEDKMKKRILLVDDAAIMRMMCKEIFGEDGYEVASEAMDGVQGVEMYKQLRPDVVLMNIVMPEMNGIEAAKKIMEFDADAKILMLSAASQPKMVLDALRAGAAGFVMKPFQRQRLHDGVKSALQSKFALNPDAMAKLASQNMEDKVLSQIGVDEIIRYATGDGSGIPPQPIYYKSQSTQAEPPSDINAQMQNSLDRIIQGQDEIKELLKRIVD